MKGIVLLAGAVATAIALWVSAAGAAPTGSAAPPARGVETRTTRIPLAALGRGARPRGLAGVPATGSYAFLLRLRVQPTALVYDSSLSRGRTAARAAATDQLAAVHTAQSRVLAALPSDSRVLYETHAVLAGVAVYTKVGDVSALQRIPGVTAVYPIAPKKPALSYSALLQRAPQAWAAYGDLGAGSRIAIIDTGVDYTHADLGGPGTSAAYQTALAHDTTAPVYPDPGKLVGGYDFAGDTYNPGDPTDPAYQPTPHPDPNPLDCDGHGTHVAGIAAGYGENATDGSTFTGNYANLSSLTSQQYRNTFRIGPGMAPLAKLYAYKVFGCAGSTDLITAAIDRAADPNGDGNPSDHVDVINMSLGADFASPQDADAVAANAASQLGISVVAAAGNGGDLYDAAGAPGNATRAIAVANSVDAYSQIDTLHVSAPAGIARGYGAERSVAYDWATKPNLSGTVVALSQSTNKDGCDALSPSDAAAVNGKIAFLEWTDDDATRRCGSAARSANVKAAGAVGAILADDEETFAAGITGSDTIPVVLVTKSAGDAIRGALGSGVTISGTSANDFSQLLPGNDDEISVSSSRGSGDATDIKPDVSAVGTSVFSAAMGTGNEGISFTGTSMASPMVAGLSALVRTEHPSWNPEEVKADIMNTAGHDLFTGPSLSGTTYAPARAGAGRIDAKAALDNQVLAYVAGGSGAVGVSFGAPALASPTTFTKTIAVVNKGATSATYGVAYQPLTQVPGAAYAVSPSSVSLAAGQTKVVTVTLTIDPAQLTNPIDPTVSRTQGGFARDYLAEASGRVLLTSAGRPTLRVPVYAAPRPAATMTQPSSLELPNGKVQTADLPLTGGGIDQGTAPDRIASIVAGFELQVTSGALPDCGGSVTTGCIHAADERAADLKYVGVTSNAPELRAQGKSPLGSSGLEYFAITTQGPWRTPASANEYDVYIDSNGDRKPDYVLFNTRVPLNGSSSDVFVSALFNLKTEQPEDVEAIDDRLGSTPAAVFNSDTLVMPVAIKAISGISSTHSRLDYGIVTWSSFAPDPVDTVGVHISGTTVTLDGKLSTDVLRPGVAVYGKYDGFGSPLLYRDQPRTKLHVRSDAASYAADHGKGALIVHFHNAAGHMAQVVNLVHDTTAPRVSSLKVKASQAKKTARLMFRGTDPRHGSAGLHFRCRLDKKRFTSCRSPKLYRRLGRGTHTVQVEATDRAGNVSKPVRRRFRI